MIRAIVEVFFSRALAGLLFALSLVLLARWTDASDFGSIAALIGAAYFVMAVADFGLTQYLLRQTALGGADNLAAVRRALSLAKFTSAAVLLCCLATGVILGIPLVTAILLAVGIALDKFADNWQSVLVAERRTSVAGALVVCRRVALLGCQAAGYLAGVEAPLAFSLGFTLAGIGTLALRPRLIGHLRSGPRAGTIQVIRDSRYYWLSVASSQARELDGILVFAIAGPLHAGLFAAANRVVRPLLLMSVAAANVLLPELSRGGRGQASRIAHLVILSGFASIVVGACVAPFSGQIVVALLGQQYESAEGPLAVFLISVGPAGIAGLLGGILQSQGVDRPVALTNLGLALVAAVAVSAGAYIGGSFGASCAAAGSAVTKFVVLAAVCRSHLSTSQPGGVDA